MLVVATCLVASVVGLVAWRWVARPAPLEDRLAMASEGSVPGGSARGDTADGPAGDPAAGGVPGGSDSGDGGTTAEVVVHVTGAVGAPGVVRLTEGARVVDAVTAAGGLRPEADAQRLNLAAPLLDGSRIVVPVVGQEMAPEVTTTVAAQGGATAGAGSPSSGGEAVSGEKLDLNSATAEQLETLPGVGPATATAIIEHREAHGEFGSVDELLDVRGIGEAKLEGLRDLVVAG